jgi:hypothetical protein
MATTTFSGPVVSNNGFETGTSASPLAVTTAENINAAFATTSAATGDTRLATINLPLPLQVQARRYVLSPL